MTADHARQGRRSPLAMGAGERIGRLGLFLAGLWLAVGWAAGLLG
jgi:hypothetical protein